MGAVSMYRLLWRRASTKPSSEDDGEAGARRGGPERGDALLNEAVVRRRRRDRARRAVRGSTTRALQRSRRPKTTERPYSGLDGDSRPTLQRSRRPKTTERRASGSRCRASLSARFNEAVVRRRRRAAPARDASRRRSSSRLQRSRRPKTTESLSRHHRARRVHVASTKPSSEDDGEERAVVGRRERLRSMAAMPRFNEAAVRRRRRASGLVAFPTLGASTKPSSEDDGEPVLAKRPLRRSFDRTGFNEAVVRRRRRASNRKLKFAGLPMSEHQASTKRSAVVRRRRRARLDAPIDDGASSSSCFNEAVVRRRRRDETQDGRTCVRKGVCNRFQFEAVVRKTTESSGYRESMAVRAQSGRASASTKPSSGKTTESARRIARRPRRPAISGRFNEAVVRRRRRGSAARRDRHRASAVGALQRSRRPKTTESCGRRLTRASQRCSRFNEAVVRRRRRGSRAQTYIGSPAGFNEAVVRRRRRGDDRLMRRRAVLQRSRRPKTTERTSSLYAAVWSGALQRSRRPKTTESGPRGSAAPRARACFNEAVVRRRRRGATRGSTRCGEGASTKPSSEDDGERGDASTRRRRTRLDPPARRASTKPSSEDDGEAGSPRRSSRAWIRFNEAVVRRRRRGGSRRTGPSRALRFNEAVVRRRRRGRRVAAHALRDLSASTKPSSEDDGEPGECVGAGRQGCRRRSVASTKPSSEDDGEPLDLRAHRQRAELASTKPSSEDDGESAMRRLLRAPRLIVGALRFNEAAVVRKTTERQAGRARGAEYDGRDYELQRRPSSEDDGELSKTTGGARRRTASPRLCACLNEGRVVRRRRRDSMRDGFMASPGRVGIYFKPDWAVVRRRTEKHGVQRVGDRLPRAPLTTAVVRRRRRGTPCARTWLEHFAVLQQAVVRRRRRGARRRSSQPPVTPLQRSRRRRRRRASAMVLHVGPMGGLQRSAVVRRRRRGQEHRPTRSPTCWPRGFNEAVVRRRRRGRSGARRGGPCADCSGRLAQRSCRRPKTTESRVVAPRQSEAPCSTLQRSRRPKTTESAQAWRRRASLRA